MITDEKFRFLEIIKMPNKIIKFRRTTIETKVKLKTSEKIELRLPEATVGKGLKILGIVNNEYLFQSSVGIFKCDFFQKDFLIKVIASSLHVLEHIGGVYFYRVKDSVHFLRRADGVENRIENVPFALKGGANFAIYVIEKGIFFLMRNSKPTRIETSTFNLPCIGNKKINFGAIWEDINGNLFSNAKLEIEIGVNKFFLNVKTDQNIVFTVVFAKVASIFVPAFYFSTKLGKSLKFISDTFSIVDSNIISSYGTMVFNIDRFWVTGGFLFAIKKDVLYCLRIFDERFISYNFSVENPIDFNDLVSCNELSPSESLIIRHSVDSSRKIPGETPDDSFGFLED